MSPHLGRSWRAIGLLVLFGGVLAGAAAPAAAQDFIVWYERSDGSTYLRNISADKTLKVDGYTIASEFEDLINGDYDGTKGWKAIEDILTQFQGEIGALQAALGAGALAFGSAPQGGNAANLSELNLAGSAAFEPGEQWFLGKPFSTVPIADDGFGKPGYSFSFKTVNEVGAVADRLSIRGEPVPEPSALVLAGVAALGLAAARRARKR